MEFSRIGLALAVVAAGMSPAVGPAAAAETYEMKIGFVTVNDSQHKSANWFSEQIAERTDGRINARVFPLAQLGTIPRQVEGIQLGTQEAFISPPGFFVGINPGFQAPDAPALFESFMHQYRTLNHPSVRAKFLRQAEHAGIVGGFIYTAGDTSIASREPIRTLDDLKGKKIRVLATKMEVEFMGLYGATGVPMPYSEVLPAIQRRVLDGVRSGIVVMGPSKFYTVAKHITLTGLGYIPSGMWLSKAWLDRLPAELREAVMETAAATAPHAVQWAIEITRHWEKEWARQGGTVHRLSEADQAEMVRRAKNLGDEFLGNDPKTKEMYELIKAAAALTREG